MTRVMYRLVTILLATGSSIAIATAGSPSQGQPAPADHVPTATAQTQLAPVAFWLGLEQERTTTSRSNSAVAEPVTHPPAPPAPAASHVPPLATPAAMHVPPLPSGEAARHAPPMPSSTDAIHVPPLAPAAAAQHVPPLPASADAAHVPPLPAAPPARMAHADARYPRTEVLKPLAITYVVPGPLKAEAPSQARTSAPPPRSRAQSPSHEHAAAAAAPLPLPPAPAPRPPELAATAKPVPAPARTAGKSSPAVPSAVIRVADQSQPPKTPGVTKLGTKASAAGGAQAKAAATKTDGTNPPPVGHLKIGVGGGILVHLPQPAATVFAANPAVARVEAASPTAIFVIGMTAGATNLIATNSAGEAIAQWVVTVGGKVKPPTSAKAKHVGKPRYYAYHPHVPTYTTWDSRRMQEAINQVVPGANLVKLQKVGDAYILTGVVATPEIAQEVEAIAKAYGATNLMDKMEVLSSIQVNVRVRVADVSRTMIHQLGLNWSVIRQAGNWQLGLFSAGAAAADAAGSFGATVPPGAGQNGYPYQLGAGATPGPWKLNSVIDALASNQLATILAEPNLTVESGHSADFLSGGQYPIPVPSAGSNSYGIEYKNYGVSLSVTPTVIAPDKISLKVTPTVSELDYAHAIQIGTSSVPALTVQKASTVVQLGSGQAFAIAGLLKSGSSQDAAGLPGAEGVPVLGALFRDNTFNRDSEELVIIVTPYLVNPVSNPAKLHAPTDNFVPATDLQQILFGKQMQGKQKAPKSTPPLDAGFLME